MATGAVNGYHDSRLRESEGDQRTGQEANPAQQAEGPAREPEKAIAECLPQASD